ncbi:MAG: hypothetical protein ACRDJF_06780 [Actinomycetota bacterium]
MNRRQRIVVALAVVAAVISLGFGFLPFSAKLRVRLPFLDLDATVNCGPPFLEMFGDDQPCTDEARERAGGALVISLVLLAGGGAGTFVLREPPPPKKAGGDEA